MKKITYSLLLLLTSLSFAQVGIGNVDPKTTLDVNGAISLRDGAALNLNNGNNNNVSLGATPNSFYRITGPTANFNLSGIVPATNSNGQIVTIENTTAQNFSIIHDASSTAANRIYCPGATNLNLSGQFSTVTLSYNSTQLRWIVIGSTDNPYGKNIQSVTGNSNTNVTTNAFQDMADMSITFTPKHNVVYLNFSASGDMQTSSRGSYVEFRIVNVTAGTNLAGTVSLGTDHDDLVGTATAWNAQFVMYPVTVTAGTPTTLKIQWLRDGITPGNARNQVAGSPDFSHRNLTIFD